MVITLDRSFFGRTEQRKLGKLKSDLKQVLLKSDFFEDRDEESILAFEKYYEAVWADASNTFSFNYPVNIQKYVLIILTQSKWTVSPLHYQYAKIMIGSPNRPWRIESGIRSVYQNIVRQHYLNEKLSTFIDKREEP